MEGSTLLAWQGSAPGAAEHAIFESSVAQGPFTVEIGTSTAPSLTFTQPMPTGSLRFFLVGGRKGCGLGPLDCRGSTERWS